MVRIPTLEEAHLIARDRLADLCNDAFPQTDPKPFFNRLSKCISVPNDQQFQLLILQNCAFYFSRVSIELRPTDVAAACRLVRKMRRAVAGIDQSRDLYEDCAQNENSAALTTRAQIRRECFQYYQDFIGLSEQLDSLCGWPPSLELYHATDCVDWVKRRIDPPFASCDSKRALRDLDELLDNWARAAGTKQGRRASDKMLDSLILSLAECFQQSTGKSPSTGKVFLNFVEIVVNALTTSGRRIKTEKERASLKKRIERALKPRVTLTLNRDYEF